MKTHTDLLADIARARQNQLNAATRIQRRAMVEQRSASASR